MQTLPWTQVVCADDAPLAFQAVVPSRARWLHALLLAGASMVLLLAALLKVRNETEVIVPWLGLPLPELCYWKKTLGMPCPGCGLTRCFISLAHGDLTAAWHFNPAGILLFAATAFQIPFRIAQLWRLSRGRAELDWPALPYVLLAACVLLVLQWFALLVF